MYNKLNLKYILFIGILCCIVLSLYWIHTLTIFPKQQINNNNIDSYLYQLNSRQYDQDGKLLRKMSATYAAHYPQQNINRFHQPHITLFGKSGLPWFITAKQGKSYHDNQYVYLAKDVVFKHAATGKPTMYLYTDHITYDTQQKLLTSDAPVKIVRGRTVTTAIGMRFNLKTNLLTLLSQMHTHFMPADV